MGEESGDHLGKTDVRLHNRFKRIVKRIVGRRWMVLSSRPVAKWAHCAGEMVMELHEDGETNSQALDDAMGPMRMIRMHNL